MMTRNCSAVSAVLFLFMLPLSWLSGEINSLVGVVIWVACANVVCIICIENHFKAVLAPAYEASKVLRGSWPPGRTGYLKLFPGACPSCGWRVLNVYQEWRGGLDDCGATWMSAIGLEGVCQRCGWTRVEDGPLYKTSARVRVTCPGLTDDLSWMLPDIPLDFKGGSYYVPTYRPDLNCFRIIPSSGKWGLVQGEWPPREGEPIGEPVSLHLGKHLNNDQFAPLEWATSYRCPYCGRYFRHSPALTRHFNTDRCRA